LFLWGGQKHLAGAYLPSKAIKANTIIEISPVIVMSPKDRKLIDQTALHNYIFEWGNDCKECCMALGYRAALQSLVSI
jgi:hypothetical protein